MIDDFYEFASINRIINGTIPNGYVPFGVEGRYMHDLLEDTSAGINANHLNTFCRITTRPNSQKNQAPGIGMFGPEPTSGTCRAGGYTFKNTSIGSFIIDKISQNNQGFIIT